MSLRTTIESLAKTAPPPKFRAAHGQWVPYAWMVRGLAEAGQPIMEAARIVVREMSLEPHDLAIRSIRQAYYAIRNKPWPEETESLGEYGKKLEPDAKSDVAYPDEASAAAGQRAYEATLKRSSHTATSIALPHGVSFGARLDAALAPPTPTEALAPPTPTEALTPAAKAISAYPLADEDFIV